MSAKKRFSVMSNDWFKFKKFTVCQDKCAMKVGTDGVLLGAWADGGVSVLDVGTGSGLVALMMAQRFQNASIDAIDIDEDAYRQATVNAEESVFKDRIRVFHASLQEFAPLGHYDAVVCNPPFFCNSLRNPDKKRALARHDDRLDCKDLLAGAKRLLGKNGTLSVIIPADACSQFISEGVFMGLSVEEQVFVKTKATKKPKRCLLRFGLNPEAKITSSTEVLLNENGEKSEWYRDMTSDFYL